MKGSTTPWSKQLTLTSSTQLWPPLYSWLLLILTCIASVWIIGGPTFRIKQVQCHVEADACPAAAQNLANSIIGTSIWQLDSNQLEQQFLKNGDLYKSVNIQRNLPDQVLVQLERSSLIYSLLQTDQQLWPVNQGGELQMMTSTSSLPVVVLAPSLSSTFQEHGKLDPALHQRITQMITAAQAQHFSFHFLEVADKNDYRFHLDNQVTAQLNSADSALQLQKLDLVLHSLDFNTLEPKPNWIDVRFKYPVLQTR